MAEGRRHSLSTQLDIEQILLEAQNRWLRPVEICEILQNYQKYGITPEPPNRPPGGSLFLFDRNVERHFRKDGHNWRKKKDGTTVKESHEKLKIGSVDVLHCYYAHGEENEYFQRRSYWMLEGDLMHIVLVHYREVKGNKTNYGRTRDSEETSEQGAHSGSPISSNFFIDNNQVLSRTMDTSSLNSAHISELDDAKSALTPATLNEHLSNIPMLNESNFTDWKEALLLTLGCLNLDTALMEPRPANLTDNSSPTQRAYYEKWTKANRLSLMMIKRYIAKNIHDSIPDNENAKDYLASVEQQFQASDNALAVTLISKLSSMRYDGTSGIRKHIMQMRDIAAQLNSLEMTISENYIVQFILNSLPPQFGPFKISYNTQKDKWTTNEFVSMCVQEEGRLKQEGQLDKVNLVFNTLLNKRQFPKGKKGLKKKGKKPASTDQIGKKGSKPRCFFCRKKGHLKKDCLKRQKWFESRGDYQGKQLNIPGLNFVSLGQENPTEKINNSGLSFQEPRKQNGAASWDEALEHSVTQFQGSPSRPSVSSTLPANVMGICDQENVMIEQFSIEDYGVTQEVVANSKSQLFVSSASPANVMGIHDLENVMIGQLSVEDYGVNQEAVANSKSQLQWQIASEDDSSHVAAWPMGQKLNTELVNDLLTRFQEQEGHYVDVDNDPVSFSTNSDKGNESFMPNEFHLNLSNSEVEGLLTSGLDTEKDQVNEEDLGHYSSTRHPFIDCSTAGDAVFKKFDSFSRWMSKELGEVNGAHVQSSSGIYWSTVESGNEIDDSGMSPQVHDAYLLSPPSLSQDQLFSILDFSPNWAYTGMETKVLITGTFLKDKNDAMKCKWSCMFGEVEVLAEVLADGVLGCRAPAHAAGRVPFYITCSNRVACSEVREFEYRIGHSYMDTDTYGGDTDTYGGGTTEMILRVRLGKLLSLDSVGYANTLPNSAGEKSHISSKISSLLKEDDNEWFQMEKLTKERLLQRILKDKLHAWLLHKVADDGKGPSVLDKEGQGVLHLAAALGYDWAIAPTIAAGVNINFRDVNGWSALHWAASCGREQTVITLVALGGAPGALTHPTPEFPSGRAPADLASINGHEGIAGYLAESSLKAHLEALTLETFEDSNASGVPRVKAIQTIAELSPTQYIDGDIDGQPLKDSLTAVRNAVQAAARIHEVFRVQSFQRKQLIEFGDDKFGMSDERALSFISFKSNRAGQHNEPTHTAAIRIPNKFRGWRGRKEFFIIRQRIVKIKALVRGCKVQKHYRKIIWSVGILEKVILRWRRKGSGLRGFRPEGLIEVQSRQGTSSEEDDYDFLKEGRKQTEARLDKALARVRSMVQYPAARDQYHRLLNGVSEFQETKVVSEKLLNDSEEVVEGDDMIDFEVLFGDATL